MPRPLTKPHRLHLALSEEEHRALSALGAPLGPAIVRAALGWKPSVMGNETRTLPTMPEAVARIEAAIADLPVLALRQRAKGELDALLRSLR